MKIRLNKNSRLHRQNCEGGFAGISAAAIGAAAAVAGAATAVAGTVYGIVSSEDAKSDAKKKAAAQAAAGGGTTGGVSPEQQYFLQQEALLSEYASQKQTQDSTRAANYAYEQAETSKTFFTYAAVVAAAAIGYVLLKKNKVL